MIERDGCRKKEDRPAEASKRQSLSEDQKGSSNPKPNEGLFLVVSPMELKTASTLDWFQTPEKKQMTYTRIIKFFEGKSRPLESEKGGEEEAKERKAKERGKVAKDEKLLLC